MEGNGSTDARSWRHNICMTSVKIGQGSHEQDRTRKS